MIECKDVRFDRFFIQKKRVFDLATLHYDQSSKSEVEELELETIFERYAEWFLQ